MADFEPLFELKNQYRESCPVLLQSGALYREEPTASAEAEETETAEATLPAEQEEAASPRTFLRLAFRNIDPRAVTSVYVDIHIFDKATNELAVVRDRRYLVPILGRDAVFGADEEIDVDDAAYSFSVAIKKVQFEGEDVFWNGSASLLFENLPEQAKIADVMEDEDLRAQYQRDFTEMAEDKEAAAQFVPQEYKDLWMCACGEVNHKDEEKCAACGAEYGPQHALFEDEEKLKENLEAYNKAEAEKAEAARIAAEKKAAEEKAEEFKSCLDFIKETLGEKVTQVRVSSDLGEHPVTMVPDGGMSFEMEKYFRTLDPNSDYHCGRILEVNPAHAALLALKASVENDAEKAKKYAELLYCQGLLMANLPLEDPTAYTDLVCELMK